MEAVVCSADLVGLVVRSDARVAGVCRSLSRAARDAVDAAFPPLDLTGPQSIAFVELPPTTAALWNVRTYRFRGTVRERMLRRRNDAPRSPPLTVDASFCDIVSLDVIALNPLFRETREFLAETTAIRSLAPLARLSSLVDMQCKGCQGVTSIRFTGALPNLRTLNVAHTRVRSVVGLPRGITDLNISYTPVEDLRPLASLPSLAVLNLEWAYRVFSIEPIIHHPSLHTLNLSWSKVVYVSDVVDIPRLRELTVLGVLPTEMTRIRSARPDLQVYF